VSQQKKRVPVQRSLDCLAGWTIAALRSLRMRCRGHWLLAARRDHEEHSWHHGRVKIHSRRTALALSLLSFIGLVACSSGGSSSSSNSPPQKGCTEEAKVCPDGSAVGRTGPSCEFSPCPETSATAPAADSGAVCKDQCGDGTCQEIVCQAIGCPCSESPASCPKDCKQ